VGGNRLGGVRADELTASHGLLKASLLTAIPFAAVHIPLQFEGDWTCGRVSVTEGLDVQTEPVLYHLNGFET
jgi:hypothetical protein